MKSNQNNSTGVLTRREFIYSTLSSGLMVASLGIANPTGLLAEEKEYEPTPTNIEGPFYKEGAPETSTLYREGDPGMPLYVNGTVMNTSGEALPNATVEVWQTDHHGEYDQDGFDYRATVPVEEDGSYQFESRLPGHYSIRTIQTYGERVEQRRPQHIHYRVTAPDHRTLITQLYFETDPFFEGNPDKTLDKDEFVKHRELIRPVVLASKDNTFYTKCNFDIIL